MQLCKLQLADGSVTVGVMKSDRIALASLGQSSSTQTLADVLHCDRPARLMEEVVGGKSLEVSLDAVKLLAPIDRQEVWAAGVTYQRSQTARREESQDAGSFYDKVYAADRPELFFKATPRRVVGPGQCVRLRQDTQWCVPEPELALIINPEMKIVGYTIGDDVSCRDIEGENPLYLPQAKVFEACCALGPVVTLAGAMPALAEVQIELQISRDGKTAYAATTELARMARSPEDLVGWLAREQQFPDGVILLTGTGIVPPDDFTLQPGDQIAITITGIGTLRTGVALGKLDIR